MFDLQHTRIQLLTVSDRPAVEALWRLGFPDDSDAFVRWYFETQYPLTETLGIFDANGLLSACLQMAPYQLSLRGKTINAPMITGAVTHPEAQRRGLMAQLLQAAFSFMRTSAPTTVLYPFNYGFYQQYGYACVSQCISCHLDSALLQSVLPESNIYVPPGIPNDFVALRKAFTGRFGFHAIQDQSRFERLLQDAECDGGQLYALKDHRAYSVAAAPPSSDGTLLIADIRYDSYDAFKQLLSGLSRLNGVQQIDCVLPVQDAPHDWLPDSRGICTLDPFLMLRVLDPASLLLGMNTAHDAQIVLDIQDEQNVFSPRWKITSERGAITQVIPSALTPNVSISAQQFARWVCGRIGADGLSCERIRNASFLSFLSPLDGYFTDMY